MFHIHSIPGLHSGASSRFLLIAGPCVVENQTMVHAIADQLIDITGQLEIPFVFKASYRKANRSSVTSFQGIGDELALSYLKEVAVKYQIPVTTDIHSAEEAVLAAKYVDILQIPAFLCRQSDLLHAAAKTGKVVNVKKGQFLSPESMRFVVEKIRADGNEQIMLTDRGTMFGYQDLIVDYRGIPTLQSNQVPVILDCTHSLQQPNQSSGVTGGRPDLIETIASAGIAVGVDGLFIETHPNPSQAKSDGANMLPLNQIEKVLRKLVRIYDAIQD